MNMMAASKIVALFVALWCSLAPTVAAAGTNEEGLAFLEENKGKPGVITLPSGLQYKVLTAGAGEFHPGPSSPCSCHYAGTLIDGTTFDSSYDRGDPSTFAPNQVIAGWTEAMQLMVQGDKWEMYIPSDLGYGDRGSPPKIPGGSVLIFTMEILDISGDAKQLVPAQKCHVVTRDKCSDKDNTYLDKVGAWTKEKLQSEQARLGKLMESTKHMKPELAGWVRRRLQLLDQLTAPKEPDSSSDGGEEAAAEL